MKAEEIEEAVFLLHVGAQTGRYPLLNAFGNY
jgi:hypothetical protein